MKKFFLISLILVVLSLTMTGCGTDKSGGNDSQEKNERPEVQGVDSGASPGDNEMFLEGGLDDLEIGQRVLVMGSENEGGSVRALRIIIGNKETDFLKMMPERRALENSDNGDVGALDQQAPPNFSDERPDFSQFQNLNEEERAKFREERPARRGASDGSNLRRMTGGQKMARLTGEIISKDDTSLTLKLEDGGSRIVFFSEASRVSKVKE